VQVSITRSVFRDHESDPESGNGGDFPLHVMPSLKRPQAHETDDVKEPVPAPEFEEPALGYHGMKDDRSFPPDLRA